MLTGDLLGFALRDRGLNGDPHRRVIVGGIGENPTSGIQGQTDLAAVDWNFVIVGLEGHVPLC